MESQSLRTASSYINNLLLSRGLLRNGVPIEFAKPNKAEGGVNATMGKIMNLVHDLILRRDVSTSIQYGSYKSAFDYMQDSLLHFDLARDRYPYESIAEYTVDAHSFHSTDPNNHTPRNTE